MRSLTMTCAIHILQRAACSSMLSYYRHINHHKQTAPVAVGHSSQFRVKVGLANLAHAVSSANKCDIQRTNHFWCWCTSQSPPHETDQQAQHLVACSLRMQVRTI